MQINRISTRQNFGMPIVKIGDSCDLKKEIIDLVQNPDAEISDYSKKRLLEAGRKLHRLSGYHDIVGTLGDNNFPAYICFIPKTPKALAARMSLGKDPIPNSTDRYIDAYTIGVPFRPFETLPCDPVQFVEKSIKLLSTLEPRIGAHSKPEEIAEHFEK